MKKTYTTPVTNENAVTMNVIMSSVSANGIKYGGVDDNGSLVPSAKERNEEWEEM